MGMLLYNHPYTSDSVANILKDSMNSTLEIYPLARKGDPWKDERFGWSSDARLRALGSSIPDFSI